MDYSYTLTNTVLGADVQFAFSTFFNPLMTAHRLLMVGSAGS